MKLDPQDTVLVVVDIQGKLAQLMHGRDELFANLVRCVEVAKMLELPVIWLEQNPDGLGPTIPELAGAMPEGLAPIPKMSFSCCGEPDFIEALKSTGRGQVLLCGIETHICIYQTAVDLLELGCEVQVVADAVSSRKALSHEVGLKAMESAGVGLSTVEMFLFEMLGSADSELFKAAVNIVK